MTKLKTNLLELTDLENIKLKTVNHEGKRYYLGEDNMKYPSVTTVVGLHSKKQIKSAVKAQKKRQKRDPWSAYIDSLEPTGVASKCTTTCRKNRKRKAQVCETFCEPILPVGTKANAEL